MSIPKDKNLFREIGDDNDNGNDIEMVENYHDDDISKSVTISVPSREQRGIPELPAQTQGQGIGSGIQQSLIALLNDPERAMTVLDIDEKQLRDLRSLMISCGTGVTHKFLSGMLGDVASSTLGALISSYVAHKVIRKD